MKKIAITLATIAAIAPLTACAVDPATSPVVSADGQFTLDTGAFSSDSGRLMTSTSGPVLDGTIESRSVPHAFVISEHGREPVGAPALVHDGAWSLQLPDGTISLAGPRIALEANIAPGEPTLIEQTFALAEITPAAAE